MIAALAAIALQGARAHDDALNRLTGRNSPGQAASGTAASYDGFGNLLSKAGTALSYDSSTRRLNGRFYDGSGNVIDDGTRLFDYTPWNVPWMAIGSATSMSWDYDHDRGRTVERSTLHGTTFFAPGGGFELVVPTETTTTNPKTIERTYIPSPEGMVGTLSTTYTGNPNAAETQSSNTGYWHKDHLGSLVAITDAAGSLTQRFTFDAWGKRNCLNPNGTASTCSANGSTGTEERGYTGHEMLDEIGLVHMNGRLYDPTVGRFLQADPLIQDPMNGQNYNRYAYVGNNPLSFTDPTGFSWWTKWRRPLFSLVAAFAVPWAAGELMMANATVDGALAEIGSAEIVSLTSTGQAIAAVSGGAAAGGISGGNVQSAVVGAFTAGAQFGVGQVLGHATPSLASNAGLALQKAAAHAAIGCASAAASGGSCKAGAASAGFSSLAGGSLPGADNILGRAAIGAVAAKLAGGKAEQGALLAAMEGLYNDCSGGNCTTSLEQNLYNWMPGYKFGTLIYNKLLGGGGDSTVWEAVDGVSVGAGVLGKALQAMQGGMAVLGHYPQYTQLAERLGAEVFDLGGKWATLNTAQRWAANRAFLDQGISKGTTFVLATDVRAGMSYFRAEIQYLLRNGYEYGTFNGMREKWPRFSRQQDKWKLG